MATIRGRVRTLCCWSALVLVALVASAVHASPVAPAAAALIARRGRMQIGYTSVHSQLEKASVAAAAAVVSVGRLRQQKMKFQLVARDAVKGTKSKRQPFLYGTWPSPSLRMPYLRRVPGPPAPFVMLNSTNTPQPTPNPPFPDQNIPTQFPKHFEGWYQTVSPWAPLADQYYVRCAGGPGPCPYTTPHPTTTMAPTTTAPPTTTSGATTGAATTGGATTGGATTGGATTGGATTGGATTGGATTAGATTGGATTAGATTSAATTAAATTAAATTAAATTAGATTGAATTAAATTAAATTAAP